MAQIIVSTIDSENGSINVIVKFEDSDLTRIYQAYKHSFAEAKLNKKFNSGEILEASDTVDNLKQHILPNDILASLVSKFIKDLVHGAYNIEQQIVLSKNPIEEIVYNI